MKTFDDLLSERDILQSAYNDFFDTKTAQQNALEAALVSAAKAKGAKKAKPEDVYLLLSKTEISAVRDPFQRAWDDGLEAVNGPLEANKLALHTAAVSAEFSPLELRARYVLVKSCWVSSYRSQGFGAVGYARNQAESYADKARLYDVKTDIRMVSNPNQLTEIESFDVFAFVADGRAGERDVELLRYKPEETLREWVRKQWLRGSNPRVSMPFLAHGYEESVGLDFFGGELKK